MSAYRNIASKAADEAETKKAVEFLMKADDTQVRDHISGVRGNGRDQEDSKAAETAEKMAKEAQRAEEEEAERQRRRAATQRL